MPVYTCTTTTSTLTSDVKSALAKEISRIHAEINHVPSTYVNVVFHELPAGGIYTDGVPANPVLVNGWVPIRSPNRQNHPSRNGNRGRGVSDRQCSCRPGDDGDPKQPGEWRGRRRPYAARARARASVARRRITSANRRKD